MNELNIGKANVVVAYDLEDIAKVKRKYGRPDEPSIASAFRRMTAECIVGVRLTVDDLKEIDERRKANYEKRMMAREQKKCH